MSDLAANVPFSDLRLAFGRHQREYEEAALRVLRSGWYILGKEGEAFEREFASFLGMGHCAGVGCGQDALTLALRALGIGAGDEVIVAGNSYIATVLAVTENGATPVFVDCNEYFELDESKVEAAITPRTAAVLTTNLYGQCCDLRTLRAICDAHAIALVEDCAQSHGASFAGRLGGTWGDVSCFSFYPTKPIGAFGDAGAVVTNNAEVDRRVRALRNYGSRTKYVNETTGTNSRMDEVQAALLRVSLSHVGETTAERARIAQRYLDEVSNPAITLPHVRPQATDVWHIFPVLCETRDDLRAHLESQGVHTQVHYPIPPFRSQCYAGRAFTQVDLPVTDRMAATELSLPIYCGMPEEHIDAVIAALNGYRPGSGGQGVLQVASRTGSQTLRYGTLRGLGQNDAEPMLEWMRDPAIAACFQADFANMTRQDVEAFIARAAGGAADPSRAESLHLAIADPKTDEYLGTVSLKHIDRRNLNAEYAVVTRAKAHGTGAALQGTCDLLRFAFDELGLHRVYLNVLATNARAIRFYEKAGFVREGCSPEQVRRPDGTFADLVWFGVTRHPAP